MPTLLDAGLTSEQLMAAWCFLITSFMSVKTCQYACSDIKPCRGLYFWSSMAASLGVWSYSLSSLLQSFALVSTEVLSLIMGVAWIIMGTGNSLLLHSRVHLAITSISPRRTYATAASILASLLLVQLPASWNLATAGSMPEDTFQVHEITQVTALVGQEALIMGVFAHGLYQSWKLASEDADQWVRDENRNLIQYLSFVFAIDVMVLVAEHTAGFRMLTVTKSLIYSLKIFYLVIILNDSAESVHDTNLMYRSRLKRQEEDIK
ncbi:uncharacterized protein PG998_014908 [Apiospora kogelbergensis]|uniref:uncharacterized protein n=1 Tax=Apiospora kogelbergensis TaxID=1337665 RepID=UPI00312EAB13